MKRLTLTVVINGQPIVTTMKIRRKAFRLMRKVIRMSANVGTPDRWELRDVNGHLLDPAKSLKNLGIAQGAHLYLNLKAGVGGNLREAA